jgi:hypothetical protein
MNFTNPMFHRHLVLAYSITWILQLSYLAYVGLKWKASPKDGD